MIGLNLKIKPGAFEQITIGQMIGFHDLYGKALHQEKEAISETEDGIEKDFSLMELRLKEAFSLIAFFSNEPLEKVKNEFDISLAMKIMEEQFEPIFNQEMDLALQFNWQKSVWHLPPIELNTKSKMTFGEFIDSKVSTQNAGDNETSTWEMLLNVACIFLLKPEETYNEEWLYPDSQRIELMKQLPVTIGRQVGKWFEEFNNYLKEYFPLFGESSIRGGIHTGQHMQDWGWINFLKEVAKTKIYDISGSGMNSIECARKAKAFDVLVDASEEKLYNEAKALDTEALYKKK